MIILLDTSTPTAYLTVVDGDETREYEWQAERQLAHGLLKWLEERLSEQEKNWQDITGIGAFQGPGSFTGLRIGLTVLNTLADSLQIPIVGANGDAWQQHAIARLQNGDNDRIVLPHYGSDANITKPRK
jgi:tRNA threonylcarbamoyladenosine biosynthesis protein TsaB